MVCSATAFTLTYSTSMIHTGQMDRELPLSITLTLDMRESSTVGIATVLWTGRSRVRFLVGERHFALLQNIQTSSMAHPAHSVGTRCKASGVLTTCLHAKVKNNWSFSSAPSICLHGMEREILFSSSFFLLLSFLTLNGRECLSKRLHYSLDMRLYGS